MKRAVLLFWATLFSFAVSAQTIPILDLKKLTQDQILDSVDLWYRKEIIPSTDSSKAHNLLKSYSLYADQVNDVIVKATAKFYLGHFYSTIPAYTPLGIKMMEEAIASIDREQNKYVWIAFMHDLGEVYLRKENYAKSLEYQLRAMEGYKELGIHNYPQAIEVACDLAYFYYHLGNYMACLEVLLPIADIKHDKRALLEINNNIGLAYREMDKPDSAIYFLKKTLNLARKYKEIAWVGIAAGNISATYLKQEQHVKASPYAQLYYQCILKDSTSYNPTSIGESLIYLAEVNLYYNKVDNSIAQLKEAERYIFKGKGWNSASITYKFLKRTYNDLARAYAVKKEYLLISKYMLKEKEMDDSISRNNFIGQYTKVQLQLQVEKNLSQIKLVRNESRLAIQRRNFSLAALVLIGLLLLTLVNRQRLKHKKDKEFLEVEKIRAQNHLTTYVNNLHEKNNMIEEFEKEIQRLQALTNKDDKSIETLYKLQQSVIITEEGWREFKALFEKVHKGFFARVKRKYPDLSQADIRILALAKLNISNKEMSNMLGISPSSIRTAKYRLTKKINLPENTNFSDIVDSI